MPVEGPSGLVGQPTTLVVGDAHGALVGLRAIVRRATRAGSRVIARTEDPRQLGGARHHFHRVGHAEAESHPLQIVL